jgi:terminase small subunit
MSRLFKNLDKVCFFARLLGAMARPSRYSKATADKILDRIRNGETMTRICSDPDMPARATVYKWLANPKKYHANYLVEQLPDAFEMKWDNQFDRLIELAETCDPLEVQKMRLVSDNIKWCLARAMPKKYGDKIELGGKVDGDIKINITNYSNVQKDSAK